jgi:hypothetical protein
MTVFSTSLFYNTVTGLNIGFLLEVYRVLMFYLFNSFYVFYSF